MIPRRIIDLSQPVFSNCPQYPDKSPRPAQVRWMFIHGVEQVNKEIVEISTHTGTHCDAPFHFFDDGLSIDRVPLEQYVCWATVIDLRGKEPGSAIEAADIEPYVEAILPGDVALLNTGWGHKRANTKEFLTEYVYCSGDAAELLVRRGVRGAGIDAVSFGGYDDPAKAGPAHRAMLGAGCFIVEELYFPDEIMDGRRRLFVAAPVKLAGCSGGWTRAMLWEYY
ncbi:MAG TPA: cyclase family protein [Candidatus Acidoferrales bacterium]|nr:cyclase family protein [Candidatus Acidoferrales bacterium]